MNDASSEENSVAYVPDLIFEEVQVEESDKSDTKYAVDGSSESVKDDEKEEEEEEEFAFNLFSSSTTTKEDDDKKSEKKSSVVILAKDNEITAAELLKGNTSAKNFIDPNGYWINTPDVNIRRPDSFYFSGTLSDASKSAIEISSVSFEDVVKLGILTKEAREIRTDYGGGKGRKDKIIDYTELAEKAKLQRLREKKHRRPGKKTRERTKKIVEEQKRLRKEDRERQKLRRKQFGGKKGFVKK